MAEDLTLANIKRLRELYESGPGHMEDKFLHDFLIKVPALLLAAEHGVKEKEVFDYVCGGNYSTTLGLMVLGKEYKEEISKFNEIIESKGGLKTWT
jgi:hypothetical protein